MEFNAGGRVDGFVFVENSLHGQKKRNENKQKENVV
jgi:hypothetical protein